ncbi:YraN family protein [Patescibacteria group bacterium]|nr:YraN family protein [Patescibacteria group bacterium]
MPTLTHQKSLGQLGENLAAKYLEKQGYKILACNYSPKRWGEIDIIAIDDDTLVFIEVKTRIGEQMLEAFESIDKHKLQVLKRTAQLFIREQERKFKSSEAPPMDIGGILAKPSVALSKVKGAKEGQNTKEKFPEAYRLDFISVHFPTIDSTPEIELFKNIGSEW